MRRHSIPSSFRHRHIGPSPGDVRRMLEVVGAPTLDALIDEAIPGDIRQARPLDLGPALSEPQLLAKMREVASRNHSMTSLIGQGYYGSHLPAVIQRNVLENPAWYTAYTPYQPEISQGRLEALLNFQTMIVDLTGLEIANASLLDEATAAAEAMTMARRVTKSQANAFFVDRDCHPQTIAVVQTRAEPLGWNVIVGDPADLDPAAVFGALFQYPGSSGSIVDHARVDQTPARSRRRRHHGRRSVGTRPAGAAGRTRRGHCGRLNAAVRRADGIWRSARGVHRDQSGLPAGAARSLGRREHRQPGPERLPPDAANTRAAYPA